MAVKPGRIAYKLGNEKIRLEAYIDEYLRTEKYPTGILTIGTDLVTIRVPVPFYVPNTLEVEAVLRDRYQKQGWVDLQIKYQDRDFIVELKTTLDSLPRLAV